MKIFFLLIALGFIFSIPGSTSFANPSAATGIVDTHNQVCPVSGDKVSEKFFADYAGKRYYFCCKGCVRKFNKNPKKFIS